MQKHFDVKQGGNGFAQQATMKHSGNKAFL
jgi:hypothetical protein